MKIQFLSALVFFLAASITALGETRRVTVLYDDKPTAVNGTLNATGDLWVSLPDLKLATRFVVKPQGVCRDELCFPIPKKRQSEFLTKQKNVSWFNLSEFARLIKQPTARDEKNAVYYFGARADAQNAFLNSMEAPDFTLPDINGKMHSLSDYRGKKVLLVTWASW